MEGKKVRTGQIAQSARRRDPLSSKLKTQQVTMAVEAKSNGTNKEIREGQ